MRIAIIGYSGSGKSTLAGLYGKAHGLPVLHLDTTHWLPGWQERPKEERASIVRKFLDENESWVIDGNYSGVFYDERMEKADRIIFMNFNRFTCLYRAWKRKVKYSGKSRPDMTEGCNEKLDREFAMWILRDSRTKKALDRYRSGKEKYPEKFIEIHSQRELDAYIKKENLN